MALQNNWSYPTAIRFGAGRISEIGEACVATGMKNPLLVTDKGLASMEITTRTLDLLDGAGFSNYEGMDVPAYQKERIGAFAEMLRHLDKIPVKG